MLSAKEVLQVCSIIPVLAIEDAAKAVDIAYALKDGGINIMEITLRTDAACDAISKVAQEVDGMMVGAGTVINTEQFKMVKDAGARFVISPGMTESLLDYAQDSKTPFIPGVANASDVMLGMEYGLSAFKLFPAHIVGGVDTLKAFSGPFKEVSFCPTGGVNINNLRGYLDMPNVLCVGGTWICPSDLIKEGKYEEITRLCKEGLIVARGNTDAA